MRSLGPYEVITAIVGRPHDDVVPRERLERIFKNRSRQVRAVAVKSNHAFPSKRRKVCKDRSQASREALPFLPHYARHT